jgi:hypothetical protein
MSETLTLDVVNESAHAKELEVLYTPDGMHGIRYCVVDRDDHDEGHGFALDLKGAMDWVRKLEPTRVERNTKADLFWAAWETQREAGRNN